MAIKKRVKKLEDEGIIRQYNTYIKCDDEITMLIGIITTPCIMRFQLGGAFFLCSLDSYGQQSAYWGYWTGLASRYHSQIK